MKYVVVRGINFTPEGSDTEKRLEPGDSASGLSKVQLENLLKRGVVSRVKPARRSKKVSADG